MRDHSESIFKRAASMDGMNVRQALRVYCDLIAAIRPFKSWAAIAAMLQDAGVRPNRGGGPIQPRTLSAYWREINARGLVNPARSGSIGEALRAEIAKAGLPVAAKAAARCSAVAGALSRAAPRGGWQVMVIYNMKGSPLHG